MGMFARQREDAFRNLAKEQSVNSMTSSCDCIVTILENKNTVLRTSPIGLSNF